MFVGLFLLSILVINAISSGSPQVLPNNFDHYYSTEDSDTCDSDKMLSCTKSYLNDVGVPTTQFNEESFSKYDDALTKAWGNPYGAANSCHNMGQFKACVNSTWSSCLCLRNLQKALKITDNTGHNAAMDYAQLFDDQDHKCVGIKFIAQDWDCYKSKTKPGGLTSCKRFEDLPKNATDCHTSLAMFICSYKGKGNYRWLCAKNPNCPLDCDDILDTPSSTTKISEGTTPTTSEGTTPTPSDACGEVICSKFLILALVLLCLVS